jgi:hypothetical protein
MFVFPVVFNVLNVGHNRSLALRLTNMIALNQLGLNYI